MFFLGNAPYKDDGFRERFCPYNTKPLSEPDPNAHVLQTVSIDSKTGEIVYGPFVPCPNYK